MPSNGDQGDIVLSANRTATSFLISLRSVTSLTNVTDQLLPATRELVIKHCHPILTSLNDFAADSHQLATSAEHIARKIAESLEGGPDMIFRAQQGLLEAQTVHRSMEILRKNMSAVAVSAGQASQSLAAHAGQQQTMAGNLSSTAEQTRRSASTIRAVKWICVATVTLAPVALGLNAVENLKRKTASQKEDDAKLCRISSEKAESIGVGFNELQQAFGTLVLYFATLTQSLSAALSDRSWGRDSEDIFLERAATNWRECELSNRRYRDALSTGMSIILPWDGVDCDGCGRKNLTGRFKCMICRDFDLCSDCVSDSKTYHPQHADSLQLYYSHKCDSCKRHLTSAEDWWRCSDCEDYDLCLRCVEQDNHYGSPELGHQSSHKMMPVFSHHQCDNCEQFPIFGPRYDCTTCDDYCLCHHCKSLKPHDPKSHLFVKMDYGQRRQSNVQG